MKRSNFLFGMLSITFLLFFIASNATATTIYITPETPVVWSGTDVPAGNPDADDIETITGYTGDLYELYKQDVGEPESGPWANWYTTSFFNSTTDPSEASIVWDGTIGTDPYITGNPLYLLVKDGQGTNTNPWWYVFDLLNLSLDGDTIPEYSWNGTDTIYLQNFWDGTYDTSNGAISHVSLYGPATSIPEPATILLLGAGLIGMACLGRKKFL